MSPEELAATPDSPESRLIALEIALRTLLEHVSLGVRARIVARADRVEAIGLDANLTDVQIAQIASLLRSMH